MQHIRDYLPRRAEQRVHEALDDTRVVVVNGARQTGKSTLAQAVLARRPPAVARFLDDPMTRVAAAADPAQFIEHEGLMVIDEVQRVPDLWLAIKRAVDRDQRPGQFLLTGSARLLSLRSLPDALPGRTETVELWPLSQGEMAGEGEAPDGFVDAAFARDDLRRPDATLRRSDYVALALRGGYPEAWRRDTPRRRQRFFEGYVSDLIVRDVQQVADIAQVADMRRLVSLLAAQTGGLLNVNRLANDLAISAPTVSRYLAILEAVYLVHLLPAWSTNLTTRAVAAPKVLFVDSGLAGHLASGAVRDAPLGGLLETFAVSELARQLTWSQTYARLYHYRDRDQVEVDAVLEDNAGYVVGVEVKAAETVRTEDFRGLRLLQRRLGERFLGGYVLYCGVQSLSFGEGLAGLPMSALWRTDPGLGSHSR